MKFMLVEVSLATAYIADIPIMVLALYSHYVHNLEVKKPV